MLEVKYIQKTGIITAWAGSPEHIGGHFEPEAGEAVAVLDIPNPEKPSSAYLYDEATQTLIPNLDYVEPEPLAFTASPPGEAIGKRLKNMEDFLERLPPG
ncbi:hypothetical protein ES708_21880 [subsurface metagenome]